MLDNLCEELIAEIFTRLPVKCLLRFRSVSKSLRSCIDSPAFIRKHASRSPKGLILTHHVNNIEQYRALSFCTLHAEDQLPLCPICGYIGTTAVKFPRNGVVVASCNEILLLFHCGNGIGVWNPSIMRLLTLPDCPRRCFHPAQIGIGFDPITDDHKIVKIPLFGDGNGETPFVYAIKTGAWRPIASLMPLYSKVSSRSCYLNGVVHWVVERCFPNSKKVELRYIMTFDTGTHVFGMIALPKPGWETHQMTTIDGSLAVISEHSYDYRVWVKRDASWSVVFKNQFRSGIRRVVKPTNSDDLLISTFGQGFQIYNPKTGSRSTLVKLNDTSRLFDMDLYVETLHLLNMGTPCEENPVFLKEEKDKANLATSF